MQEENTKPIASPGDVVGGLTVVDPMDQHRISMSEEPAAADSGAKVSPAPGGKAAAKTPAKPKTVKSALAAAQSTAKEKDDGDFGSPQKIAIALSAIVAEVMKSGAVVHKIADRSVYGPKVDVMVGENPFPQVRAVSPKSSWARGDVEVSSYAFLNRDTIVALREAVKSRLGITTGIFTR